MSRRTDGRTGSLSKAVAGGRIMSASLGRYDDLINIQHIQHTDRENKSRDGSHFHTRLPDEPPPPSHTSIRPCHIRKPNVPPMLLYGLECLQLGKADLQSLDFTFNRLCMKLSKTGSIHVVKDCPSSFAIYYRPAELCLYKKSMQDKFILRYNSTMNGFCKFCR